MGAFSRRPSVAGWLTIAASAAAAGYAMYAAATWLRYGHPSRSTRDDEDPLLDRFMPRFDVVERHHIRVRAPAATTFAAACEADLQQSAVARAIFRTREVLLGSDADDAVRPAGLLAYTKSIGWGVLAELPDREIVMGAVTRPWQAKITFRALPPDDFAAFNEPGYVKIVWTLRADPLTSTESVFRSETRAVATDRPARVKFRRYWSLLSPGIIVIRWLMLGPVKAGARRSQAAARLAQSVHERRP
jgi:hypothetical protein